MVVFPPSKRLVNGEVRYINCLGDAKKNKLKRSWSLEKEFFSDQVPTNLLVSRETVKKCSQERKTQLKTSKYTGTLAAPEEMIF